MTLPDAEALAAMVEAATAGPWRAEYDEDTGGTRIYCPSDYLVGAIGNRWSIEREPEKVAADAALIALAPQLAQEVIRLQAETQEHKENGGWFLAEIARLTAVAEDAKRVAAETVQANAALVQRLEEARAVIHDLERAATVVANKGAETGPHWTKLTLPLLRARAFLGAAP